jgi:type I restriction enzyme S subunit
MITEGGEVGRCAVWHDEITPCFYQKAIHRVRCNVEAVLPDYLAFWFKMHADYNRFEDIVGGVTSIAHLPGVKLKRMEVVMPPISLQEKFVVFIRQVDKSKSVIQKSLDETQLLFDKLMQDYFG